MPGEGKGENNGEKDASQISRQEQD